MSEEQFEFSKHPNYLEWYQCYDDLSNKDWEDGMELRRRKEIWDERAVAKWNFLYRPFKPVVGRPQQKMIGERKATIDACENYIKVSQEGITRERKLMQQALRNALIWSGLWVALTLWLIYKDVAGAVFLPVIAIGIIGWRYSKGAASSRAKLKELESHISLYRGTISNNRKEITLLEEEIRRLLAQIPRSPSAETIEKWLREEIHDMELACLSELVGKPITAENVHEHLRQDFGDKRVSGLLVDSWGFLQPATQKGPYGQETTGLSKAKEDLQKHIATWQVGVEGRPVFRLLFLQYIFPLERNLNICSFFYDFVTRRAYGKRFETFQYNHVTNYSIREIEAEEESWVRELGLTTMSGLLQGKELKALTIAVASGNHFRCVLVDEDVVDVLNQFMEREEKYRQLEASLLSDADLRERFHGDQTLIGRWKESDKLRIEAEMKQVLREKQQVQWQTSRPTRAVLAHVRNCIEEYVLRFQQPA